MLIGDGNFNTNRSERSGTSIIECEKGIETSTSESEFLLDLYFDNSADPGFVNFNLLFEPANGTLILVRNGSVTFLNSDLSIINVLRTNLNQIILIDEIQQRRISERIITKSRHRIRLVYDALMLV